MANCDSNSTIQSEMKQLGWVVCGVWVGKDIGIIKIIPRSDYPTYLLGTVFEYRSNYVTYTKEYQKFLAVLVNLKPSYATSRLIHGKKTTKHLREKGEAEFVTWRKVRCCIFFIVSFIQSLICGHILNSTDQGHMNVM